MPTHRIVVLVLICAAFPTLAWGHPGHGRTEDGLIHYLTEPVHVFGFLAIVGAALGGFAALRRLRRLLRDPRNMMR